MRLPKLGWKAALDIVSSVTIIVATVVIIWFQFRPRTAAATRTVQRPTKPVSIQGAALSGVSDANAVLIIYSDFQCPFCRQFAQQILPQLEHEYVAKGKLQLAFRHFPLPIHNFAAPAAVAVECAGRQNLFWEMHDATFKSASLDEGSLERVVSSMGMDLTKFKTCEKDADVLAKVRHDVEGAMALGINATPSFFLGSRTPEGVRVEYALSGAKPVGDFRAMIDHLLR
jgi:protein-disulfide isomerase